MEAFRALFSEVFLPVLSAQEGWGRASQQHTAEFLQVLPYIHAPSLLPSMLSQHDSVSHSVLQSGKMHLCQTVLESILPLHGNFSILYGFCQRGTTAGVFYLCEDCIRWILFPFVQICLKTSVT